MQKSNPKVFRNTVKMLGDFLHKARLIDGRPIKFLTAPVLQYLDMLLKSGTDQDLQLFTTQVRKQNYNIFQNINMECLIYYKCKM